MAAMADIFSKAIDTEDGTHCDVLIMDDTKSEEPPELTPEQIHQLGQDWIKELLDEWEKENPEAEQGKCGGEGGTPGPCPEPGATQAPVTPAKPLPTGEDLHQQAEGKASKVARLLKQLPGKVVAKVKAQVEKKYNQLKDKYGKGAAIAIMAAGILGTATPVPGGGLLAAAPVLGVCHLYQSLRAKKAYLTKSLKPMKRLSEEPLTKALQAFFNKQAKAVLDRLGHKALPADDWHDLKDWTEDLFETMRPIVATYYDHAAKETVSRIGAARSLLKVVQPALKEGIDKATLKFCDDTNASTSMQLGDALKALRETMAEGLEGGEVQNQLAKRVRVIFDEAEVTRSYLIAHTEASRAQHAAAEITAQESGLVSGKRWLLSANACDKCIPLSGKVVGLGENFVEGIGEYGNVPYPPLHPACRCDMIEVIEGVND